jgi:hypothetical protein
MDQFVDPTYEFNAPTDYTDLQSHVHPGDSFFGLCASN